MKIGDDFVLGPVPTIQPSKTLTPNDDEEAGDSNAGRFDELFNTVFAASNTASKALSEASRESAALLVTGQLDDLSGHMVTNEKNSIQFELNLNIRNKVLDAYSEVMKFSI